MSNSFNQFILQFNTEQRDGDVVEESVVKDIIASNLDSSGGFSPVVLYDSDRTAVPKTNPSEDSPGTGVCDTSSSSTPLVFSKAEEFISATLSSVKIGAECSTMPILNSSGCNQDISINKETKSDSIKLEEPCAHADVVGGVDRNQLAMNKSRSDEEETSKDNSDAGSDDVDSKSALKTPYIVNTNKDDVSNNRSNSISDSSGKMWREGMDKTSGESSKTMFISQNLTKKYDKADAQVKGITYDGSVAKIMREITYFDKILDVIGNDMRNTEFTKTPQHVLAKRQIIQDKINSLRTALDKFYKETLEGDVRDEPPVPPQPVERVQVEYVHPPEKKTAKEAKAELCLENVDVANSLHKCSDCGQYITIGEGESIESAMENHCNSSEHRSLVPTDDQLMDKKQSKSESSKKLIIEKVPRQNDLNQYKSQSRQMMLNQITSQMSNGQVMLMCNPCGETISVDAFTSHVGSPAHKDNLNNFNIRLQKDLILKYPDLFGPGKMYHLTDMHTVMNKIFVDPLAKYSYCGLCRKELPSKQLNIDEHITSKAHEKLLLHSMDGKVSKAQQKDVNLGSAVKTETPEAGAGVFNQMANLLKNIAKIEENKTTGSMQPIELDERDKVYVATSADGKYICLLCDARGITSIQCLVSHLNGGPHKNNLDHLKQLRGGLDPDAQMLFIKNMVGVTYGRFPLVFECFACCTAPFVGVQGAIDHINSSSHIGMLLQKQQQQKAQYLKPERRESRHSNVATSVILHRNGVNFWCLSCRFELLDITSAYRHVLLPGHLTASVDGVSMLQGTQFYCEYCSVVINGEKNVGQHIVSQRHRQQVLAANKGNNGYDAKASPSFSRTQTKRAEDEKNGNKPLVQSGEEGKLKIEERMLLHKNFVNILKKNLFQCKLCESEQMTRNKILTHIFSYEHTLKMQQTQM